MTTLIYTLATLALLVVALIAYHDGWENPVGVDDRFTNLGAKTCKRVAILFLTLATAMLLLTAYKGSF